MKWIKHTGNEMPVSGDTLVLIKMRDGETSDDFVEANEYGWNKSDHDGDILEYALEEDLKDQEPQKTLRDEFAMAALTGNLAYSHVNTSWGNFQENCSPETLAQHCYSMADAMMKARSK